MRKGKLPIVISVCLVIILAITIFFINANKGVSKAYEGESIKLDSEEGILLINKLESLEDLKNASYDYEKLSNEDVISFVVSNSTSNEYSLRFVKLQKIRCDVTSMISFKSNSDCSIRIYDVDLLKKKANDLLNYKNLEIVSFSNNSMECKYDNGKRLYCNIIKEKDTKKNLKLSRIKAIYKNDDAYDVYEYYLFIDFKEYERCASILGAQYCSNYQYMETPYVSDDVITEKGILYKHIFKYNEDGNLYLEKSIIVD
jgi:hypothetical protein